MKKNGIKWDARKREYIFSIIRFKYGPQESWNCKNPVEDDFLEKLSTEMKDIFSTDIAPSAINMQLEWAITEQEQVAPTQSRTYILCKAAAIETGLIKSSLLPKLMLVEKG